MEVAANNIHRPDFNGSAFRGNYFLAIKELFYLKRSRFYFQIETKMKKIRSMRLM